MTEDTELFRVYIAGFFDGEGCISVGRIGRIGSFGLRVSLTQSERYVKVLKEIRSVFGGSLFKTKPMKECHAVCYRLRWHGEKASKFLESTCPYLRLKRSQVQLGIKFYKIWSCLSAGSGGGRQSPKLMRFGTLIKEEMSRLNRTGPLIGVLMASPELDEMVQECEREIEKQGKLNL